jgi:multicomponent Na+:H+ antiporter subunit E
MSSLRVGRIILLVGLWVLLWGRLTVANVLSGIIVAAIVVLAFPTTDRHRRTIVRPAATARLAAVLARELVVSNAGLTRDVLARHPRLDAGLVDCPLACTSPWVGALVANLLALSPGTVPVNVDIDEHVLRLHVLHLHDPAAAQRRVAHLEALVVRAFGTPNEVASLPAAVRS